MRHTNTFLSTLVLLLALTFGAFAQEQLPAPDAMRNARTEGSFNENGPAPGSVLYGAVPPGGQNAPVLLFIHGYSSSAATWYEDNSMYSNAYYAGYRTAFVSVYPDRNSWENGAMFANMIQTVCNAYGVSKLTVVAHSKGGVDSDAALIHYGAFNKVNRVVTLGTPHFGTPLADLAQSGWVSWLSAAFGQFNDATAQLQTGTMSYFRSITDNHPNRPQTNFRVAGGTDYYGSLWVPGWYLSFTERQNDGVVTYSSTRRPNSFVMAARPLNHSDIAKGDKMWNNILPQLPSSSARQVELPQTPEKMNPNAEVVSRTEILTADQGTRQFLIPAQAKKVRIQVRQLDPTHSLNIRKRGESGRIAPIGEAVRIDDNFWGGHLTGYELTNPEAGQYLIESNGPFVAMISHEEGVTARLTSDLSEEKLVYALGEPIDLKLSLENLPAGEEVTVTGFWKRTSDLRGVLEEGDTEVIRFESQGISQFKKVLKEVREPGVYNLSVAVEGKGFRRNLVTSFAVVPDGNAQFDSDKSDARFALADIYPNPSSGQVTLRMQIENTGDYTLRVYDMSGRAIETLDLGNYGVGQHQFDWSAPASLRNGMYIVELSNGTERLTKRLVLMR